VATVGFATEIVTAFDSAFSDEANICGLALETIDKDGNNVFNLRQTQGLRQIVTSFVLGGEHIKANQFNQFSDFIFL
jgi:hypothetical protein